MGMRIRADAARAPPNNNRTAIERAQNPRRSGMQVTAERLHATARIPRLHARRIIGQYSFVFVECFFALSLIGKNRAHAQECLGSPPRVLRIGANQFLERSARSI